MIGSRVCPPSDRMTGLRCAQMRPITVKAVIPASPTEVMTLISDTRNDPLWCPNVETAELIDGDGVAIGSKFRFHQHLDRPNGKRIEFDVDVEVIELDDLHVKWLVNDRFQKRTITISVAPTQGATIVTQTTEAEFHSNPGIAKYVYPLLAKRIFKDQFKHLSDHFTDGGLSS